MDEPQTIGGYRLEARIGAGAHGAVYRALHPVLQTPVAIRVLDASLGDDARTRERLLAEANRMRLLNHPGVVHCYDVGVDDGRLFYVLELLAIGDLQRLLEHGTLPAHDALLLGRSLAATLAYAHAQGVLHGDLKPSNVLFREDGSAAIGDFGSWILSAAPAGAGGSPYLAPEQLRGERPTPQSDVYALGVMIYEMVAGHPPFGAAAARDASQYARPPQLRSFDERVPRDLDALIATMLAADPAQRPRDMAAVVRTLEQVLGERATVELISAPYEPPAAGYAPPPVSPPLPPRARREPRVSPRLSRSILGLATGFLALTVVLLVLFPADSDDRRASGGASPTPWPMVVLMGPSDGTARPRATEVPLTPVDIPIVDTLELVEPRVVALGDERWTVGNVGVYQDGTAIRIYGLLRNDLPTARRNVDVRAILRDSAGAELASSAQQSELYFVAPGALTAFDITFDDDSLPPEGSYSVDFEVRGEPADDHDIQGQRPVAAVDVAVGRRDDSWAFEGRFTAGERTIENPHATAVCVDRAGKVVGIGYGRLKEYVMTMPPGDEANFGGIVYPMEKQPARMLLLTQGREYLREPN